MKKNDIDIKAIIAQIKSGIEKATESQEITLTREKVLSDVQDFCVDLCNIKKVLCDIIDCINIDSATDNKELQIERSARLNIAVSDLQSCIESLIVFHDSNKEKK